MKAVLQRVRSASVKIDKEIIAGIGRGLLVLVGVARGDDESDAEYLAEKVARLRIFEDENGKMNLSLADVGGSVLAVSQFTLYADCRKGRRPSFTGAEAPERGEALYHAFVDALRKKHVEVSTGRFGAKMLIDLCNDGPVTIIVESGDR
jgi:D-tyrosyl-tRNA(Tyr) deacylase